MQKNNQDADSKVQYMPIGMCIGIAIGTAIGVAMDNIGVGMCLGMGIGLCFGSALDAANNKKSTDAPAEDQTEEPSDQ